LYGLPVWAALGAKRYLKIALPETVERVTIFADNDPTGLIEAEKFRQARNRFEVGIVRPELRFDDFASQWQARLIEPHEGRRSL
jgi:putative DNA primase/helicase